VGLRPTPRTLLQLRTEQTGRQSRSALLSRKKPGAFNTRPSDFTMSPTLGLLQEIVAGCFAWFASGAEKRYKTGRFVPASLKGRSLHVCGAFSTRLRGYFSDQVPERPYRSRKESRDDAARQDRNRPRPRGHPIPIIGHARHYSVQRAEHRVRVIVICVPAIDAQPDYPIAENAELSALRANGRPTHS